MILSVRFRVRKEKRRCWATCSQYYLRLMTIWVRSAAAFASQCRAWGVGEQAATTLALVVHELATNSLKYGALSSPTGTLDISCAPHDTEVVVVWTERGGPTVAAPAGEVGYGSKLLNRGMTIQLGGSITFDWSAEGVIVSLQMTKDRLAK
jgi:two-component sensor histidine kinase